MNLDINMAQSGLLWEFDDCWVDYHWAGFRLVGKRMGKRRLFSGEVQKSALLKEQTDQLSSLDSAARIFGDALQWRS